MNAQERYDSRMPEPDNLEPEKLRALAIERLNDLGAVRLYDHLAPQHHDKIDLFVNLSIRGCDSISEGLKITALNEELRNLAIKQHELNIEEEVSDAKFCS